LAAFLMVVAAGVAYLWTGLTTSGRACNTGQAANALGDIGLALIWLAVPVGVAWQARRAGASFAQAVVPAVGSAMFAPVFIWFASAVWWSGHNCVT
jgi:hypothetical protein